MQQIGARGAEPGGQCQQNRGRHNSNSQNCYFACLDENLPPTPDSGPIPWVAPFEMLLNGEGGGIILQNYDAASEYVASNRTIDRVSPLLGNLP